MLRKLFKNTRTNNDKMRLASSKKANVAKAQQRDTDQVQFIVLVQVSIKRSAIVDCSERTKQYLVQLRVQENKAL